MRKLAGFLFFMMFSLGSIAFAQVSPSTIDALFSKFESARDPGCAVLVIKDGKAIFRKGYGVAELRAHEKIGPGTNFRLASVTKRFNAIGENNATVKSSPISPLKGTEVTRLALVEEALIHAFDHYGQMVVYLRMNGVVPPASRP